VSTTSPASLPLQEENDDLELAFELASPSRIAYNCCYKKPIILADLQYVNCHINLCIVSM
jgi:hypothetical protein